MRRPLFMVCLCLVAAVAIQLSLKDFFNRGEQENSLGLLTEGEAVTVTGLVYQKDVGDDFLREFRIKSVEQFLFFSAAKSQQTIPIRENLICETVDLEDIRLGCRVTLQGIFEPYDKATNSGEFDAEKYYSTQKICGKLTEITIIEVSEEHSWIREKIYCLKCNFKKRLYQVFPEKEASVLSAMLLGDKEDLDVGVKERYMDSGIIHILSISGLHITMIGMGIYRILRRIGVPIWVAACLGAVTLVLFGIMTGMSVSACRAIGMYLIRMLAVIVGRTYDMLTALGVMAVCLVMQNPGNLSNAGFYLSFGSIMGIGLLYPVFVSEKKGLLAKLLQSFAGGCSITLFTLPIQLWFYYEVPTYSVLINLLVLPFMSAVMATGMAAMLVPGAGLIGTITCLILQGYEWLCVVFEQLPFPRWNPGKPDLWQVVCYYFLLIVFMVLRGKQGKRVSKSRKKDVCQWFLLPVALIVIAIKMPVGNTVTFLDVGQGDGIVWETATGQVFVFDCGSSSRKQLGKNVLTPFLKYRGIDYIDAVFISHADIDHCSGIKELLELGADEGIRIGQLILPAIKEEKREQEFGELIEESVSVSYVAAGDSFTVGDLSFLCLHPPQNYESEDGNASSLCFYAQVKTSEKTPMSILFTGDVEGEGEELLLKELQKRDIGSVTVLKVAHHGSRNSTSTEFLKQIKPQVAIISCGENNSYGHPHNETITRLEEIGAKIFYTMKSGQITLKIQNDEIRVNVFQK